MGHFNWTNVLTTVGLALSLAACGSTVDVETREKQSAGALEKNNSVVGCATGDIQRATCVDPGELKLEAYNICLQSDTVLTDLQFPSWCANGLADSAQYTCCTAPAAPPVPPPPAPPSQPNPGCVFEFIGDGQTCQNLGDIKLPASEACFAAGMQLTNIFVQDQGSCNNYDGVNLGYECCPVPPPPPPPVVCLSGSLGDGQACLDLGGIKTSAWQSCEQAGLILFDLQIADVGGCAPTEALLATYQCTAPDYGACP